MTPEAEARVAYLEGILRDCATDIAMGRAGMITAIRAWRGATGATLKDSKDYVEALSQRAPKNADDARMQRLEDRLFNLEQRVNRSALSSPDSKP